MIQITIFKNDRDQCVGFQTEGHAGMAEAGQDIVCAAASILVLNTINAIETFAEDEFSLVSDEVDGIISFHLSKTPTPEAELLLDAMILGLESMADDEDYSEFIYLDFEEV